MKRLSSTWGTRLRESLLAEIADHLRVQPVELRPLAPSVRGSNDATSVKRESRCQFAMSGPVARWTSSVGVRRVDHVVTGRARAEGLLGPHVEAAAIELVQQAEARGTDRLRVGQPGDEVRAALAVALRAA